MGAERRSGALVSAVLSCYPRWWRERYEHDARSAASDLVSDGRSQLSVAASYGIGAVRAHFGRQGGSCWSADRQLRASVTGMLPACLVFVVLSVAVLHSVWIGLLDVLPRRLTFRTVPVLTGTNSVAALAILAVLAVYVAAYLSTAVLHCVFAIRRHDGATLIRLLATALVVTVIVIGLQTNLPEGLLLQRGNPSQPYLIVLVPVGFWIVLIVAAVATSRWFGSALRRSPVPSRWLRLPASLCAAGASGMVVVWIALAVRTIALVAAGWIGFSSVVSIMLGLAVLLIVMAWSLRRSLDGVAAGRTAPRSGAIPRCVNASDGPIGRVHGLVVDPSGHQVTHVLLDEGHRWGKKEICVPISSVTGIDDAGVQLSLSKKQVGDLPPIDIEHST
jgi:hypothetical protein